MVVFIIEDYEQTREVYSTGRVYDELLDEFGVSEEDAIEAESWCELAYVGEVYQGEDFTITVMEE